MNTLTASQQEIAIRAYQLYLDSGCRHGNDWNHWFQAEKEIGAKFFTPPPANAQAAKASEAKSPEPKPTEAKVPDAKPIDKKAPVKKAAAKKVAATKSPPKKTLAKK